MHWCFAKNAFICSKVLLIKAKNIKHHLDCRNNFACWWPNEEVQVSRVRGDRDNHYHHHQQNNTTQHNLIIVAIYCAGLLTMSLWVGFSCFFFHIDEPTNSKRSQALCLMFQLVKDWLWTQSVCSQRLSCSSLFRDAVSVSIVQLIITSIYWAPNQKKNLVFELWGSTSSGGKKHGLESVRMSRVRVDCGFAVTWEGKEGLKWGIQEGLFKNLSQTV